MDNGPNIPIYNRTITSTRVYMLVKKKPSELLTLYTWTFGSAVTSITSPTLATDPDAYELSFTLTSVLIEQNLQH